MKNNVATGVTPVIRVCHVMSADLWAGAEVQVATIASYLAERHRRDALSGSFQ